MQNTDKKCTYTIPINDPAPLPGQYLVTLGINRKGVARVNSVWLIASVKKVKHKTVGETQGYHIAAWNQPELKDYTEFERRFRHTNVWVRGEVALPCYWLPRKSKAKPSRA